MQLFSTDQSVKFFAQSGKPGLPDSSWSKHTKMGKMYQMATNNTKRPQIMPNGCKIFKMVIKNILKRSIARPPKMYLNWDFGFENKPSGNPAGYRDNLLFQKGEIHVRREKRLKSLKKNF
jgi:hypothetical protein